MEYVYASMLLHKAGKQINEENLKKVLVAAGVQADDARVKATVAALSGVNIDEAIKKAAVVAPVAAPSAGGTQGAKTEDKKPKEDTKKAEADAAAGLGSLFG